MPLVGRFSSQSLSRRTSPGGSASDFTRRRCCKSLMLCPSPTTRATASVAFSGLTDATQYDLSPSGEMTTIVGKQTIIKKFRTMPVGGCAASP
jgi:hypothetical protein